MKVNDAKRLKELNGDNAHVKELLADAALDRDLLREVALETPSPTLELAAAVMLLDRCEVSQRLA